jgi:hypothetical protein
MTWQTETVSTVRIVIGDIDVPQKYSDARIQQIVIVAAIQVLNETDFDNIYVINITNSTIIPDPTDTTAVSIKDNLFICLISLKAACLITRAEMKYYATIGGLDVRDGPSTINTKGLFANYTSLVKQYTDDYEYLKLNYKIMRSNANSQAILTATTVRNIYGNLNVLSY